MYIDNHDKHYHLVIYNQRVFQFTIRFNYIQLSSFFNFCLQTLINRLSYSKNLFSAANFCQKFTLNIYIFIIKFYSLSCKILLCFLLNLSIELENCIPFSNITVFTFVNNLLIIFRNYFDSKTFTLPYQIDSIS